MSYQNEIFGASKQVSRVDYVSWKGKCRCFLLGCWCSRMPRVRFRFQFPTKDIKSSRILVLTVTGIPRCLCGRYGENVSFKKKKWSDKRWMGKKHVIEMCFGVPWFSLHHILGGEVFEMKRNAFGNLGALQTNTNKISEQDIFCEVYGS